MRTLAVIIILSISVSTFAAKEWPEPEDSWNCTGSEMCHGKGDYAIQQGWIDFLGKGRTDETFEIRAPSIALIGHSATYWDMDGATRESVRQLMNDLKKRNLPIVYLSPNYKINKQKEFLKYGDFDFMGTSSGGDHNLRLPETETVLLSGGFYHKCLCNSLADVITNLKPGKSMTVVLPLETVYTDRHQEILNAFTSVPRFEDPVPLRHLMETSSSKETFKSELGKSVSNLLLKPVTTDIWINGKPTGAETICPFQAANHNPVDPAGLSVEVYVHDSQDKGSKELIGTFGKGPRKLKIVFASIDLAPQYLVDQTGPIKAQSVHYDWGGGDGPKSKDSDKVSRIERTVYSRRFAKPNDVSSSTQLGTK